MFNPQPRGKDTLSRISTYPYSERPKGKRVAEVAVHRGVPDLAKYVVRVSEMQGANEIREIAL